MRTRHDSSAWRLRLLLTALGWCLMLQVGVAQGPIIVNGRPALLGAPVETAAPRPTVLEFSPAILPPPKILVFEPLLPTIALVPIKEPVRVESTAPPLFTLDNAQLYGSAPAIAPAVPMEPPAAVEEFVAGATFGPVSGVDAETYLVEENAITSPLTLRYPIGQPDLDVVPTQFAVPQPSNSQVEPDAPPLVSILPVEPETYQPLPATEVGMTRSTLFTGHSSEIIQPLLPRSTMVVRRLPQSPPAASQRPRTGFLVDTFPFPLRRYPTQYRFVGE